MTAAERKAITEAEVLAIREKYGFRNVVLVVAEDDPPTPGARFVSSALCGCCRACLVEMCLTSAEDLAGGAPTRPAGTRVCH